MKYHQYSLSYVELMVKKKPLGRWNEPPSGKIFLGYFWYGLFLVLCWPGGGGEANQCIHLKLGTRKYYLDGP